MNNDNIHLLYFVTNYYLSYLIHKNYIDTTSNILFLMSNIAKHLFLLTLIRENFAIKSCHYTYIYIYFFLYISTFIKLEVNIPTIYRRTGRWCA